jgi:hypothetical protein
LKRIAILVAAMALLAGGAASAAGGSWATKANALCRTYTAKAKALLGTTPPKTLAQAHTFIAKGVPLEAAEANALAKIPGATAAAKRALAAVRTDVAEGRAVLAAWSTSKARFATLYTAYLNDRRPKKAFLAAGASACG